MTAFWDMAQRSLRVITLVIETVGPMTRRSTSMRLHGALFQKDDTSKQLHHFKWVCI
jgi:hypothetical protein